jgi:hypothetical protein
VSASKVYGAERVSDAMLAIFAHPDVTGSRMDPEKRRAIEQLMAMELMERRAKERGT